MIKSISDDPSDANVRMLSANGEISTPDGS
jgi:hypothetical protein